MRRIFKLALIVIIALLAYNYFLGEKGERETAEAVVRELKDLGGALKDAFAQEKDRFDDGKLERIQNDLREWYAKKGSGSEEINSGERRELEEMERELETALNEPDSSFQPGREEKIRLLLEEIQGMIKNVGLKE